MNVVGNNGIVFTDFEKGYFATLLDLGLEEDNEGLTIYNLHPATVKENRKHIGGFLADYPSLNTESDGISYALGKHGYGEGFDNDIVGDMLDTTAVIGEDVNGTTWVFID